VRFLPYIQPREAEKYFQSKHKVENDFKNNQTITVLNFLCCEILKK